jgi:hypothetical protein
MIGEAGVPPVVEIADVADGDFPRDNQVVKPVSAAPALPHPAGLARLVSV